MKAYPPLYEPFDLETQSNIDDKEINHRWALLESFLRLMDFPMNSQRKMLEVFDQAKRINTQ